MFCFLLFTLHLTPANSTELHGFSEIAFGPRFGDEKTKKDEYNLLEGRLQLKYFYLPESKLLSNWNTEFFFKGEALADGYEEDVHFTVREGYLLSSPAPFTDFKIGRQILTWGTGDLLFINDLFPKDYVSFFIGRDEEYLKVPSDAGRFSFFTRWVSLNLVLIPFFEPDNIVRGDRLSFFDTFEGGITGRESRRIFTEPTTRIENTETAIRAYRTFGSLEGAIYLFRGFYKQPRGIRDEERREVFYPRLNVYGASLRGPFFGGISSAEVGYYDSREDTSGSNRLIENSSIKLLLGYERDFGNDFKGGWQYFVEQILKFDEYRTSLQSGDIEKDEFRHLITIRLTKFFKQQTIEASLFTFYSPSDDDVYLRPRLDYKVTDNWKATIGANIFSGRKDSTEFGQLEDNNNVYLRVRYSF